MSGFVSEKHKDRFSALGGERIKVASLHIAGEKDSIIESSRSEELARQFLNGEVCRHPGGHYLPYTGDVKDGVLRFLDGRANETAAMEGAEEDEGA